MELKNASSHEPHSITPISNKPSEILHVSDKLIYVINGHSPMISDHNTWVVFNDGTNKYEDTGVKVVSSEVDPTVPQWAKQDVKPTYTADEIGALNADDEITLAELDKMFESV